MRTLVTGATGLLGSHVVDALVEQGDFVRALVVPGDPAEQLARARIEICRGDLCDPSSLASAVAGIDRVLHCAARKGPWGPGSEHNKVNIRGVENLLRAAMTAGVQRFVHVSSTIVLGADIRGAGDETLPLRLEANPYSWSKIQGELLLREAIGRDHAPVTIVRTGLLYGPRDTVSFGRFSTLLQQGRMVFIGSGNNHLPLIYARDVAEGMLLASEKPQAIGQTYNLVNDEPVTQRDYLTAIARELGVEPPKRHIPYKIALGAATAAEVVGYLSRSRKAPFLTRFGVRLMGGENLFRIDKARQELGFCPWVNLAEGVRRSVAWFREVNGLKIERNEDSSIRSEQHA